MYRRKETADEINSQQTGANRPSARKEREENSPIDT
jgi:hypothetical protein